MKTLALFFACTLLAAGMATAQQQSVVTTTTTTADGTITQFVPGTTFVVKETSGPVTYTYGPSVTYVTETGAVIPAEQAAAQIKVGVPVRVHYTMDGPNRVISRVVVTKHGDDDDDDDDN